MNKKDKAFAENLLGNTKLTPDQLMAIITAATKELTQWTVDNNSHENTVVKFLKEAIAVHEKEVILHVDNPWVNFSPKVEGHFYWRKNEKSMVHEVKVSEERAGDRVGYSWLCYSITDFTDMTNCGQWKKNLTKV